MKTPYLDSQLKGYRQLAESGKMPESGMEQLRELEAIKEALSIHTVSYPVAQQYAEFCVRCDREKLPLIKIEDYLKQL